MAKRRLIQQPTFRFQIGLMDEYKAEEQRYTAKCSPLAFRRRDAMPTIHSPGVSARTPRDTYFCGDPLEQFQDFQRIQIFLQFLQVRRQALVLRHDSGILSQSLFPMVRCLRRSERFMTDPQCSRLLDDPIGLPTVWAYDSFFAHGYDCFGGVLSLERLKTRSTESSEEGGALRRSEEDTCACLAVYQL